MIPNEAFVALCLIMVVAWAFGVFCDRIITRWVNSLKKPHKESERHACDTCKYEYTSPKEYPCNECAEDDMDLWTPTYIDRCDSCKHKNTPIDEEPCNDCSCGERWER